MKRLLAFIATTLLLHSLCACTGTTDASDPSTPAANVTSGQNQTEPAVTLPQTQPVQIPAGVAVTETVLLDASGVKITAKELSDNALFGPELKLLIENNTDKKLTFQSLACSVNGYMIESMMSVDVAPGKKANDTLTFMRNGLEACGITTIADMEISFHIFGTDDWATYLETDPVQLQTSAAAAYQYTYDDSGELLYEGNGIKIVSKGFSKEDSLMGPSLMLYIHNNSQRTVTIQADSSSVNGFMVAPVFSQDIGPGKHAVASAIYMTSLLEENSITKISDIELSFHIFDTDTWDTVANSDAVTLKFN